ncbi:MAG: hypothetical protein AB1540_04565 [Bdellovibrionota bacterium]
MQIVRLPRQHLILSLLVIVAMPLFILNLWVVQKDATIRLEPHTKMWVYGLQATWMLATLRWLTQVKWIGFWSVSIMSAALLAANAYFLLFTKNYALAFYALFLLIVSVLYCLNLFKSLGEVYYSSGRRWFEGAPRFLPKVEAAIRTSDAKIPVKLSRLSVEGCYVYPIEAQSLENADDIYLKLGDLEVNCAVELISKERSTAGRGYRFVVSSVDHHKDVRDFLDRVRSAGYVS